MLATVVVLSAVVGAVGPVFAQTTDTGPVKYEYTGSPETLIIDVSKLDDGTDFSVEVTTPEGPGSPTVLARQDWNTANVGQDQLLVFNSGVYSTLNVTVSGYSGGEPLFDTQSSGFNLRRSTVGHFGGDQDVTCDMMDKISQTTSGVDNLDCTAQPGTTSVDLSKVNAEDKEQNLYEAGQNVKASSDNTHNQINNTLADAKTAALLAGKNAYIRALNNGSSQSAAESQAKQAVADWYSVRQANYLAQWDITAQHVLDTQAEIESDGDVSDSYQYVDTQGGEGDVTGDSKQIPLTLANGSTVSVTAIEVYYSGGGTADDNRMFHPGNGSYTGTLSGNSFDYDEVAIRGPTDSFSDVAVIEWRKYHYGWNELNTQHDAATSEIETLVAGTYDAYQSGEINNSDLVDPYVLASERSAGGDFQTWSAAQLTLLGQNTPDNMDSAGEFEITTSGQTYEGILTSPSNPSSGSFEANTTYDASTLSGSQMVITEDQIVEIEGSFTLGNITTSGGEKTQNATIQKIQYQTTNVTELKQQYEDLAYRRAQLEAREQALKNSGGGGFLGGESVNTTAAIVVVALVLALGIINN
nr:hypothetical protein [Haloarcula rubripromontorii]